VEEDKRSMDRGSLPGLWKAGKVSASQVNELTWDGMGGYGTRGENVIGEKCTQSVYYYRVLKGWGHL